MPEDIEGAKAEYDAALLLADTCEQAADQLAQELQELSDRYDAARTELERSRELEARGRSRYVAALRANGWHDTATGPAADDPALEVCGGPYGCGHYRNQHTRRGQVNPDACAAGCVCTGFQVWR